MRQGSMARTKRPGGGNRLRLFLQGQWRPALHVTLVLLCYRARKCPAAASATAAAACARPRSEIPSTGGRYAHQTRAEQQTHETSRLQLQASRRGGSPGPACPLDCPAVYGGVASQRAESKANGPSVRHPAMGRPGARAAWGIPFWTSLGRRGFLCAQKACWRFGGKKELETSAGQDALQRVGAW